MMVDDWGKDQDNFIVKKNVLNDIVSVTISFLISVKIDIKD